MNTLVICPRSDLAGTGIGIKQAFDRYSDIKVRQIRRQAKFYAYPHDAEWADYDELVRDADLIHVMEIPEAIPPGKKAVLHHHGSYFRSNREHILREQARRRAVGICSTLDLYLQEAGEWIGSPYDLEWLSGFRDRQEILTVAHAGTELDSKSTGVFLDAAKRLSKEIPLEVLHITGMSWLDCLRVKGRADIYFDQILTGYGNNAVEAWGMGIPVISGIEPKEARRRGHFISDATPEEMERRWSGLPFVRADEGTIYDALRLLADPLERVRWGSRGALHAARFHDQQVVVRQLEGVYRRALS